MYFYCAKKEEKTSTPPPKRLNVFLPKGINVILQ
jgi:hypothetical protein